MKHSYLLLLFFTHSFLSTMEQDNDIITLPSKNILLERLEPIKEYSHFINNTSFIDKMAGKNKYAAEVFMVLGFNIDDYREQFKNDQKAFYLEMLKPKVVTLILQDHPNAIAFLKKEKVLSEQVSLPSADILAQYLKKDFDHLATKTQLIQQLANTQKYPTEIFMIVDLQVDEYIKTLKTQPLVAKIFPSFIPTITKIILQKHPEAIQFLIDEELFT